MGVVTTPSNMNAEYGMETSQTIVDPSKDSNFLSASRGDRATGPVGDPRAWSIEEVCKWLTSLRLSQYKETFMDAAIDGIFLFELTDDDLRNTLGIEHALHRKKILTGVRDLK